MHQVANLQHESRLNGPTIRFSNCVTKTSISFAHTTKNGVLKLLSFVNSTVFCLKNLNVIFNFT